MAFQAGSLLAAASLAGRRKKLPGPPKKPSPATVPSLPPVDKRMGGPFKKLKTKFKKVKARRRARRAGRA